MKRIHVASLPTDGTLGAEASHHLLHVLRARPGFALILFDGQGQEQPAELTGEAAGIASVRATGPVRPGRAAGRIDLVVAVLKHQPMDLAVRMATEVGVHTIRPVWADRVVARGDRTERWERIASSASAQCGRAEVPHITPILPLREAVEALEVPVYTALPEAPSPTRPTGPCAVCVGPAGGFSPSEVAWLQTHTHAVGLGPHVLRAETACVIAVSALRPEA